MGLRFETEEQFGRWLTELATTLGWRVYHAKQSARPLQKRGRTIWVTALEGHTAKGFPDYVLVHARTGDVVFAELKRDLGIRGGGGSAAGHRAGLSPEQIEWRDAIRRGPSRYFLWRPADEPEIVRVLTAPSRGDVVA